MKQEKLKLWLRSWLCILPDLIYKFGKEERMLTITCNGIQNGHLTASWCVLIRF